MKSITNQQLKDYLDQSGLSLAEVSRLLDVHIDTVAKWKSNSRQMPENLFKLLQILYITRSK